MNLPRAPYRFRIAAALLLCSAARAQTLQQADAIYRAGTAALARGDLGTAQTDFAQVVRLAPGAEPGHAALGLVLLDTGHLQQAVHELQVALSLNHADSGAQLNLANAYQELHEPAKAVALFAQMEAAARLQHHPLSAVVLSAYAHALAAAGNLPEAERKMKAAVAADPHDAKLHDDLGSIEAQQRLWPTAAAEFGEAVKIDPGMAAAHLHLALAQQAQGLPGSMAELQEAQRLAPDNPLVLLELGKAMAAAGEDAQAIPLLRQVVAAEPKSSDAAINLALALQRTNHAAEAVELFRRVLAAEPENPLAATDLGMALTQAQRAKDAVPVLQHAVRLAPESVTAHQDLAAAYVQLNQFTDAEAQLQTAIQLAPEISQLHYDLGLAYKMQDDAAHAIPEFEAAERLDARQPEAPYALGLLYLQAGRYADAARELKASLALRPKNGEAWATLGSVYAQLNQLPEATAALQQAIEQLPEQPAPHLTLANVLIKENKLAEATAQRKLAAGLMRSNMNRQRAEVATNSGRSLLKAGDVAGAKAQFEAALGFDAGYAAAHAGLAEVYEAQGKAVEAAAERAEAGGP